MLQGSSDEESDDDVMILMDWLQLLGLPGVCTLRHYMTYETLAQRSIKATSGAVLKTQGLSHSSASHFLHSSLPPDRSVLDGQIKTRSGPQKTAVL